MDDKDLLIEFVDFLNFTGNYQVFIDFMIDKGYEISEITDKLEMIETQNN